MNEQHCIAVWTQKRASLVGLHYSRQVALFIVVSSPVSDPLDTAFSLLFFFLQWCGQWTFLQGQKSVCCPRHILPHVELSFV